MSTADAPRTIVIGLDSFDLRLLDRWVASGKMPVLGGMMKKAPLVTLSTPSAALQGSVWPSLLTGLNPAQHGLYLQNQIRSGTYRIEEVRADHVRQTRFYQYLNSRGLRCGLLDIPADQPAPDLNGIQVLEWATEFKFWRYQTIPSTFRFHIARRIGRNPFTRQPQSGDSQSAHAKLRTRLERSIRLKTELSLDLIRRPDLDFVFVVFGEAHKAGHWFWKYYDETHPDFEQAPSFLRDGLTDVCALLDQALGRLMEEIGPEDNLLVFSDHGMQAAYRGNHHIETVLESLGLLSWQTPVEDARQTQSAGRRFLGRGAAILRNVLPASVAARTVRPIANIDWKQTRAFVLPTDRNSYVRFNVRGREPEGIVAPGTEYRELLDELEAELYALINPATGRSAVDKVFRVHEVFHGKRVEDLPDVAVLWSAEAPITELCSPSIGRIRHRYRELRSGNHREEGFLLAQGPAFREGPVRLQGHVCQIAPTLLNMYGIEIPLSDMHAPLNDILAARA